MNKQTEDKNLTGHYCVGCPQCRPTDNSLIPSSVSPKGRLYKPEREQPEVKQTEDNRDELQKDIFDTVYSWGKTGVVTDEKCNAFQMMMDKYETNILENLAEKVKRLSDNKLHETNEQYLAYEEAIDNILSIIKPSV